MNFRIPKKSEFKIILNQILKLIINIKKIPKSSRYLEKVEIN